MAKIQSNTPLDIVINGTTVFTADSSGISITGSLNSTTPVISASFAETASYALNAGGATINTGSFATTGSNNFNGNQTITGSFIVVTGSAVELQVTNTGVVIGNIITDTHRITGSLNVSGSTLLNGNLIVSGNTTIGDATTDTITMTASTMSLGSGTGILNIDSNTFVVDGANNRVGIGKADPNSTLDITGSLSLTGSFSLRNGFRFSVNQSSGTGEIQGLATNGAVDFLGATNNSGSFNFYGGGAYNTGAGITVAGPGHPSYANAIVFWRAGFIQNGRFTSNGNLILGTGIVDTGIKLDVSGDGRFTGNLTVSGSTFIGDATTDSITMTAATMSLGSGTGILNIDSNTFVVDGANNRVGIGKVNPNSALDVNGNTILSGSLTFAEPTSPAFNGEIVRFGAGTLTTGQLYFLSSSGTWSLANANSTGSSTGMLGIAVGSSPTTNGLLIRGFAASSSYTYGTGSIVYMATGSGIMTATSPSSSNHVVRVMGYQTTLSNTIYFDPSKTWVTLA